MKKYVEIIEVLCYIFKDKWGGCIKKKINWCLKNNKEDIIKYENVLCEINNDVITFKEKDATNIIDLNNKVYTRENNDYLMEVNVKTKLFK